MPRYKVQAHDGKILTVEADDEAALDEAMADYEASTKPAPVAEAPKPAESGSWKDTAMEVVDRVTPLGSIKEIYGQLAADRPNDALKAGLAAADIASLGLAGKVKLAGQAGAAGLRGIGQALASGALGGGAAMAAEKAGAGPVGQTAAGLLGGGLGGMATGAKLAPKPSLSGAAASIQSAGGQLTPAMAASSKTGAGLAGAMESSARTNPLLKGRFAGIDEKNAEAVRRLAQEKFGADVLMPRGEQSGEALGTALKSIASKRKEAYAPAVEALGKSKSFPGFQKSVMGAVDEVAGDVSTVSADAFRKALKAELAGKKTPAEIDRALSSLKTRFKANLAPGVALDSQTTRDFKVMMNAVKDKFYLGLDNLSSETPGLKGDLGQLVRSAKGDYAEASQAMEPLAKMLTLRRGKPEAIGSGLLQSGSKNLGDLLLSADPKTQDLLRSELAKSILGEAIGKEGISAEKLKTLLGVKYREVLPLLGGESGKLAELQEAMQLARMQNLATVNPSGSARTAAEIAQIGAAPYALFNPVALKALAAKTALDAGYSYAGMPIQQAAQSIGRLPGQPLLSGGLSAQREKAANNALRLSKVK